MKMKINRERMKKGTAAIDSLIGIIFVIIMIIVFYNVGSGAKVAEERYVSRMSDLITGNLVHDAVLANYYSSLRQLARDAAAAGMNERFGMPREIFTPPPPAPMLPVLHPSCRSEGGAQVCLPAPGTAEGWLESYAESAAIAGQADAAYSGKNFDVSMEKSVNSFAPSHKSAVADIKLLLSLQQSLFSVSRDYDIYAASGMDIRSAILASWELGSFFLQMRASPAMTITADESSHKSRRVDLLLNLHSYLSGSASAAAELAALAYHAQDSFAGDSTVHLDYSAAFEVGATPLRYYMRLAPQGCGFGSAQQDYNRYAGAIEAALPDRLSPFFPNPRALIAALLHVKTAWQQQGMLSEPRKGISDAVDKLEEAFRQLERESAGRAFSDKEQLVREALAQSSLQLAQSEIGQIADLLFAQNWLQCDFNQLLPGGSFVPPVEGPLIACYGDRACSGMAPQGNAGEFYPGIDIYVEMENAPVRAAFDGRVAGSLDRVSIGNYSFTNVVRMLHGEGTEKFYTFYTNTEQTAANTQVKSGDVLGKVVEPDSGLRRVTFIIMNQPSLGPRATQHTINPCGLLGCKPQVPESASGQGFSLPRAQFASPEDYAGFLTEKNWGAGIYHADSFCSSSDLAEQGYRALGYKFYMEDRSADSPRWSVYPLFPGTVVKKITGSASGLDTWYGCGGALFVETESSGQKFITAYGGITTLLREGGSVELGMKIGTIANNLGFCKEPHLEVRFFSRSYAFQNPADDNDRVTYNACGTRMNCRQRNDITGDYENPVDTVQFRFKNHCAALEWEAVAGVSFEYVPAHMRLTGSYKELPAAMRFRGEDSLQVLCNPAANGTLKWHNMKDAVCLGGRLHLCAADAQVPRNTADAVKRNSEGAGSYTCRILDGKGLEAPTNPRGFRYTTQVERFQNYAGYRDTPSDGSQSTARTIARFCTAEDDEKDWLCCIARGDDFQFRCDQPPAVDEYTGEVTCPPGANPECADISSSRIP